MGPIVFWIFVDQGHLAGGRVTITGPQGHHLARVLRVRPGEHGVVVAGGREHEVEIVEAHAGTIAAWVLSDRPVGGEPAVAISLLQAVLPNPDFDAVIENGTAVGITRFVPVQAVRSVARPASGRLGRWHAIATSAAEQSHRGRVPEVTAPTTLTGALDDVGDMRLLALDPSGRQPLSEATDGSSAYALAVGPEGGWTSEELAMMTQRGGTRVNLGPRILRARLAPVVAAAILVQQR